MLTVAALLIGALTLLPRPSAAQEAGKTGKFRIVFTANTLGYIEPCECTGGRFGGLARRAAAVAASSRDDIPVLLMDLGNLFELPNRLRTTELGHRQAGFLVDEMNQLGFEVQAIGTKELVLPKNFLQTYVSRLETTPVLTNRAPDADIGVETVPVQRVVVGGMTLDIFNVIDPQMISRKDILAPWEEALREGLAASSGGSDPADVQIVISHMAIGVSDRWPGHFPEIGTERGQSDAHCLDERSPPPGIAGHPRFPGSAGAPAPGLPSGSRCAPPPGSISRRIGQRRADYSPRLVLDRKLPQFRKTKSLTVAVRSIY
jgi:2',3'-cyclic-nucleotide 2'-phosphodiesterase (5'-nucleotidase family)